MLFQSYQHYFKLLLLYYYSVHHRDAPSDVVTAYNISTMTLYDISTSVTLSFLKSTRPTDGAPHDLYTSDTHYLLGTQCTTIPPQTIDTCVCCLQTSSVIPEDLYQVTLHQLKLIKGMKCNGRLSIYYLRLSEITGGAGLFLVQPVW